jgi:hypothetical protein
MNDDDDKLAQALELFHQRTGLPVPVACVVLLPLLLIAALGDTVYETIRKVFMRRHD